MAFLTEEFAEFGVLPCSAKDNSPIEIVYKILLFKIIYESQFTIL